MPVLLSIYGMGYKDQKVRTLFKGKMAHRSHYILLTKQISAKLLSGPCLSCVDQLLSQTEISVDTFYRKLLAPDVPVPVDVDELHLVRKTSWGTSGRRY